MRYPAIVKPVTGTGSRGVLQVKSEQEMDYASLRAQGPVIIQDYICGPEYSIDAFCTLKGTFIGAVPRLRTEIKNGLATKTTTVDEPFLVAETKRLAELLDRSARSRLEGSADIAFGLPRPCEAQRTWKQVRFASGAVGSVDRAQMARCRRMRPDDCSVCHGRNVGAHHALPQRQCAGRAAGVVERPDGSVVS